MQDQETFEFRPDAMLPAWFVTDSKLVIRNWNPFAQELVVTCDKDKLVVLTNDYFALWLVKPEKEDFELESLWKCILDPHYPDNFTYIKDALNVLKEHQAVLDRFNNRNDGPQPIESLIEMLKEVEGPIGIKPYVYRSRSPSANPSEKDTLCLGVKVSPSQALKLNKRATIENTAVEYIDILIAYRLCADWSGKQLNKMTFNGVQPAFHDATDRHSLWEKAKAEEHAQITQLLSHAFTTPIANIKSMAEELQSTELSEYYRELCENLESNIDDLSNLSDLILFINTYQKNLIAICESQPRDSIMWQSVSIDEIRNVIAKTLRSIYNGRTGDPRDTTKILLLAGDKSRLQTEKVTGNESLIYANATETILDLHGIGKATSLKLLLRGSQHLVVDTINYKDILRKVKTTFLDLILVELILNAIKYADPLAPEVKASFCINAQKDKFDISVINNGLELKEHEFKYALKNLAMKHGEKGKL